MGLLTNQKIFLTLTFALMGSTPWAGLLVKAVSLNVLAVRFKAGHQLVQHLFHLSVISLHIWHSQPWGNELSLLIQRRLGFFREVF